MQHILLTAIFKMTCLLGFTYSMSCWNRIFVLNKSVTVGFFGGKVSFIPTTVFRQVFWQSKKYTKNKHYYQMLYVELKFDTQCFCHLLSLDLSIMNPLPHRPTPASVLGGLHWERGPWRGLHSHPQLTGVSSSMPPTARWSETWPSWLCQIQSRESCMRLPA